MCDNGKEEEIIALEDAEECLAEDLGRRSYEARYPEAEKKHIALIKRVLGSEIKIDSSLIMPLYYVDLMTWAMHQHIAEAGWKVVRTEGYHSRMPVYSDVDTGCGAKQNLLKKGVLILEKDGELLVVTMDATPPESSMLIVTGPERIKTTVEGFTNEVEKIAEERNFYRGRKLDFYGRIYFLDISGKSWDDLILDQDTKDNIWANTVGFIANRNRLREFGIPIKRGVILVGEPGTGKTLACKALLSAADGITCITTRADALESPDYLHALYELAEDISPSIVFIEDIDLIAQEREESHYMSGSALLTLLSVLDGVEERDGVVTIATTNAKETLDKAIAKRPSRFDRIIHFPKPGLKQRVDLISLLCRTIPLDMNTQEYVAKKTENFTPAQIQEVVYSLAIDYCNNTLPQKPRCRCLTFSKQEVDSAISKIDRDNKQQGIGFSLPIDGNMKRCGANTPASNERSE